MPDLEWLETDGLGGFALGTVDGVRSRRYHGHLVAAGTPPTGRVVLVNGLDVEAAIGPGRSALTWQRYAPGVLHPVRDASIESFSSEPWPCWIYLLPDGTRIEHELFMVHGSPETCLRWRRLDGPAGVGLSVRPYLSGRDYHALHLANDVFRFAPDVEGERHAWTPYASTPPVAILTNGRYRHQPEWYRSFLYETELARGFDGVEDLAAPGSFEFDLARQDAVMILSAGGPAGVAVSARRAFSARRTRERRRRLAFPTPLHRAADQYIVRRGQGRTIVAGYPWFTDWGRDTFIAFRGLCLATARWDDAVSILLAWADAIDEGMVPNRFPDAGEHPEFNSVDASLWFVVATGALRSEAERAGIPLQTGDVNRLDRAVRTIVTAYDAGTRYGIRCDTDGLLAAGEPGQQLTWMDARAGGREVTPRIGKPVEVQALWFNAMLVAARTDDAWRARAERARRSFARRFWNAESGSLYDVVDVDHEPGRVDESIRPNQIFAIGGLPHALLDGPRARQVVDVVEQRLLTPFGLRTLDPSHPDYRPRYEGGPNERDAAYHQGTVWPWLLGPFIDAWVRVRGGTDEARRIARARFLEPLRARLSSAGLGHLAEIGQAEPPHEACGCPFQAWSVAELLRLDAHRGEEEPAPPPAAGQRDPASRPSPEVARP